MAKLTLTPVTGSYASVAKLNANFTAIEEAIENTVSLDGSSPNGWAATMDANNQRLINLPDPATGSEPVTRTYLENEFGTGASGFAALAGASAAAAAASELAAAASETSAAASAATASAAEANIVAERSATATLSNKTIDLDSNTVTGTEAEFNAALQSRDFVTKDSSTGAAVIPVGTSVQRTQEANGSIRYNTDIDQYEGYTETEWQPLGGARGGAFFENSVTVSADYTISTNKNAMSAGPISIDNGVTVTVPNGSVWSIV